MKKGRSTLSRSAAKNYLYRKVFGEASRAEQRSKYSSLAALTLKRQRRKLFNNIVDSESKLSHLLKSVFNMDMDKFEPYVGVSQMFKINVESDDESDTEH